VLLLFATLTLAPGGAMDYRNRRLLWFDFVLFYVGHLWISSQIPDGSTHPRQRTITI
jgi:hypothetical protein